MNDFFNYKYDYKKIGERIRKERRLLQSKRPQGGRMTQEEFAEIIGVSRSTVIKWEKGENMPGTLNDLFRLCNLFHCELGYLLCEYDCKFRSHTDIQAQTGLSEKAINNLMIYKEQWDRKEPLKSGFDLEIYNQLGKQNCYFYSQFISSASISTIVNLYIGLIVDIKRNGLSELKEKVFMEEQIAIDFYLFQIEQEIMRFLQGFIEHVASIDDTNNITFDERGC